MITGIKARHLFLTTLLVGATLSGCTRPKQTTVIGSAAGTAIGAGLGAIIGNQTGNPGSGVAIGAVAGAATGALIGNAIQEQQEAVRAQDERVKRNEESIRAQKGELAELRQMQSDTGPSNSQYVNAYLVEQNRLKLQKRGPSPRGEKVTRFSPPPLAMSRTSEPLARYNIRTSPVAERQLKEPEIKKAPLAASAAASTTPKKLIEEKDLASTAATTAASTTSSQATTTASTKSETKTTTEPQSEAKVVESSMESNDCAEATKEREAGISASEESEKLLHLKKALRLCPNSAETHHAMGSTYLTAGRVSDASFEFKEALKINPLYEPAKESLKELDKDLEHF